MQQLVYTLRLDMKDTGIVNTGLRLKQGDSGMKIVVNVYNGGQNAFDAGSTPKIVFRRPDGASVQADMTVEASSYSYVLVGNELQVPGKELMDVKFAINSDDRESTITCCFDVVADTITPNTGGSGIYDNDLAVLVDQANTDASNAIVAAADAEDSAEDSEAWAVGERNGVPVTSGDETYENNAKYWANQANPTVLANMSDVDITSPTDGQSLIYDANTTKWVNGSGTSAMGALDDLTDVTITSATDGQALLYDANSSEWVNASLATVATTGDYSDLSNTPTIPTVDQVYDGTSANAQSGVAVASAITNKVDKTQITNPNLLDNPWFTVNQRGQNTYTNISGYCVDRWALYGDNAQLSKTDNGVEIVMSPNSSDNAFAQNCDIGNELDGKSITFSMICNNVLDYNTITIPEKPISGWQLTDIITAQNGVTLKLARHSDGIFQIIIRPPKDGAIYTFRAVKMEMGNISTLALDTAPNYATELLKCQRYFYRIQAPADNDLVIGLGFASSASSGKFVLKTPANMRTTPTLAMTSYISLVKASGISGATVASCIKSDENNVVNIVANTAFTVNELFCAKLDANTYLSLSADL